LQGNDAQRELFIPQRLVYYICLTFLLFLAGQRFGQWARTSLICGAMLLTVGFTAVHVGPMRAYDQQIADYVEAGDHTPRGQTLLPLIYSPRGTPLIADWQGLRITPFFSVDQYIAIDRDIIDLRNYEAMLDYFPVRFLPQFNPRNHLSPDKLGLMDVPQRVLFRKTNWTSARFKPWNIYTRTMNCPIVLPAAGRNCGIGRELKAAHASDYRFDDILACLRLRPESRAQ